MEEVKRGCIENKKESSSQEPIGTVPETIYYAGYGYVAKQHRTFNPFRVFRDWIENLISTRP